MFESSEHLTGQDRKLYLCQYLSDSDELFFVLKLKRCSIDPVPEMGFVSHG